MFGIVDRLLFRPPAFLDAPARASRIYLVRSIRGKENPGSFTGYRRYLDLRETTTSFDAMTPYYVNKTAIGTGESTTEMRVAVSAADLWRMFDVKPVIGRFFSAEEDVPPAGTRVAVLSYAYWQTQFGGRKEALGTLMDIGPAKYTIIGVAPEGFTGFELDPVVAFVPISAENGADRTRRPTRTMVQHVQHDVVRGLRAPKAGRHRGRRDRGPHQRVSAELPEAGRAEPEERALRRSPSRTRWSGRCFATAVRTREATRRSRAGWSASRRSCCSSRAPTSPTFCSLARSTPPRDRRPHRARREPRATADATAHRESAARGARRRAGTGDRAVGRARDAARCCSARTIPDRRVSSIRGFYSSPPRSRSSPECSPDSCLRFRPAEATSRRRSRPACERASYSARVSASGCWSRRRRSRSCCSSARASSCAACQRGEHAHGVRRGAVALGRPERARREARFAPEDRAARTRCSPGAVASRASSTRRWRSPFRSGRRGTLPCTSPASTR